MAYFLGQCNFWENAVGRNKLDMTNPKFLLSLTDYLKNTGNLHSLVIIYYY